MTTVNTQLAMDNPFSRYRSPRQPQRPLGLKNDPYRLTGDPSVSTPGSRQVYSADYPPYDDNAFVRARKTVAGKDYVLHSKTGVISDAEGKPTTDPTILAAFGKTKPTKKALAEVAAQDGTAPAIETQSSDGTRARPVKLDRGDRLDPALTVVNKEPSDKQKEAGNYQKGHLRWNGLDIAIENPKGAMRKGVGKDGKPWESQLAGHYGYIKGYQGKDKDQVDIFMGDKPDSDTVFIIDQQDADTERFDEHKIVAGVETPEEAAALYKASFSDGKGAGRIRSIKQTDRNGLKSWLEKGNLEKPANFRKNGAVAAATLTQDGQDASLGEGSTAQARKPWERDWSGAAKPAPALGSRKPWERDWTGGGKATPNAELTETENALQTPSSGGRQESNLAAKVNKDGSLPALYKDRANLLFLQGVSLGAADEITAALAAPFATAANKMGLLKGDALPNVKDNYEQGRAEMNAVEARMREEEPGAAMLNEIGGALVTLKAPVGMAVKEGGMLAKSIKGAGVGAATGAAQGFNSGNGLDDRLDEAKSGAAFGAGTGIATVPVGKAVGALYRKAGDAFGTGMRDIAEKTGINRKALQEIAKDAGDDAAQGLLSTPAKGDMLLNLSPKLAAQAENLANQPGAGRAIVAKALKAQGDEAGTRTASALDEAVGKSAGRVANADAVETERKAAGKLFETARAFKGEFDLKPLRDKLDGLIAETDGSVRSALVKARNLYAFKSEKLNAVQMHAARQAIDDQLQRPGVGGNAARLLRQVRGDIDDALKTHVPGMREADEAYSGVMKRRDALDAGREVFKRGFGSPDELQKELKAMSPAAREDFIRGARDSISEIMGTARNDAAAARRELMEKGWNAEKLEVLIGKERAAVLDKTLQQEARRANTANNVLGNSRTALRQAAAKKFPSPEGAQSDLKGVSAVGAVLQGANRVIGSLTKTRREKLSRDAATLLTQQGEEAMAIIRAVQDRVGRRLNRAEQVETLTNALALGSMQAQ